MNIRHLLQSLILLISVSAPCQTDDHNFIIEDNNVIWRQVFEGDPESKKFTTINPLSDNMPSSHEITNMAVNYKPYGMTWNNTPAYANGKLYFKYIVDVKDGKYRISVQNIFWRAADILNNNRDYDFIFDEILKGKNHQRFYRALNQYLSEYFSKDRDKDEW